jgi:hypothetical protein
MGHTGTIYMSSFLCISNMTVKLPFLKHLIMPFYMYTPVLIMQKGSKKEQLQLIVNRYNCMLCRHTVPELYSPEFWPK